MSWRLHSTEDCRPCTRDASEALPKEHITVFKDVMISSSSFKDKAHSWLSSPDAFIVDGVVAVLKRTRRWHPDGRSLRQLNKYWCLEINRHVVSILPPDNKVIEDVDIQSLQKFPNLASLNITPFCCRGRQRARSDRCSNMMGILHQLPHLNALTMDSRIISAIEKDEIDGLQCKMLTLKGFYKYPAELFKLSDLPLQEMTLPSFYPGYLGSFLACTPSLKRLSVGFKFAKRNDLLKLVVLDELQLYYFGEHPVALSGLKSIVSLHLDHPVDNLDPFRWLSKLRKLDIRIRSSDVFDNAFWHVMQQLSSLMLQSRRRYLIPPVRFWEIASGLKELVIRHLLIESSALLRHDFSHLRKLALGSCRVDGETIPCEMLTALTALHLISNTGRHGEAIQDCMDPRPIKGLKELHVLFHRALDQTNELLLRISQLSNLESLELWNLMAVSASNAFPFSGFESLAALHNLSRLVIQGNASSEILQWLRNLQFLNDIAYVDLDIADTDSASVEDAQS